VAAAALAIPDRAALIFSAYCSGIRVDFHPPACVIAATIIRVPVNLCRRGQEVQILTCDGALNEESPAPDPVLVRAMIRAHRWRDLLESGAAKSVESISRTEHANASYLAKLLSLAYLAPDLTDEILSGTQPRQLMLKHISQLDIPLDWQAQRRLFARFRG
jgi:hypothetical protein